MKLFCFVISLTFGLCSTCDANRKAESDFLSRDTIPGVNAIAAKVDSAVKKIHSGQYKLHEVFTMLNIGEDTTVTPRGVINYWFKRNERDSLIGYNFAYVNNKQHIVFNGDFKLETYNNTLTVTDLRKYTNEAANVKSSVNYTPFIKSANNILQGYIKSYRTVTMVGYESFGGEKCYVLQLGTEADKSHLLYWISTTSFLPIKSAIILTYVNNNAKRIQTFDNWITDIKLNEAIDENMFKKSALSVYNREVIFTNSTEKSSELLTVGTTAPDWELPTLNKQTLKLSSLKGQIVVMDFWFKACIPCQQQMIDLQKLHSKFGKDKVVFIGVNTIDDPVKDKLTLFLSKRKITTTIVYQGKKIENLYKTYSSPVLYIIGKDGKVIYAQDGAIEGVSEIVTKVITQNL